MKPEWNCRFDTITSTLLHVWSENKKRGATVESFVEDRGFRSDKVQVAHDVHHKSPMQSAARNDNGMLGGGMRSVLGSNKAN
jgi:hypothetical protein